MAKHVDYCLRTQWLLKCGLGPTKPLSPKLEGSFLLFEAHVKCLMLYYIMLDI
jgi:hypothetical protein